MSLWLTLYLNLVGHPPLTDGDTSRHTNARANGRPHADDHPPSPVCHAVSPSVSGGRSRVSVIQPSFRAHEGDAAASDAALTVFCDFETRNTGGCDLKTAGAWRYTTDPATDTDSG